MPIVMETARVLVVDDDGLTAGVVARLLERAQYRVQVHASGFGLAEVVRRFAPDVIIMDLQMPGLTGPAAVRVLQDLFARFAMSPPRLLVYSGADETELADSAERMGAHGWIRKGANYDALLTEVARLAEGATRDPKRQRTP